MSLAIFFKRAGTLAGTILLSVAAIAAQPSAGTLRVRVMDDLDAIIIGAIVNATDASGATKSATTNNEGVATVNGLAPGGQGACQAGMRTSPSWSRDPARPRMG